MIARGLGVDHFGGMQGYDVAIHQKKPNPNVNLSNTCKIYVH
jgi:hypothetical protein